MANKKTQDAAKPDTANTNMIKLETDGKKSRERILAEVGLSPVIRNANTVRDYSVKSVGQLDFIECIKVMREKAEKVQAGDLKGLEATLTAQAATLDVIFNDMARRAALNMGEYLNAADTFLRLALKAQSQCRTTIEALAEIKNPRPVVFVKQANIAHNQQVNNAPQTSTPRAGNSESQSNEQSGITHEQLPSNAGTSAIARQADTSMETVGALHGATDKIGRGSER